mmetsp:Transcript_29993/g.57868  ORF Transcript_29993/g.57868 Transcript_29993/m.57868 type:complete len:165 (+) Transcript_29993:689-1183(+)
MAKELFNAERWSKPAARNGCFRSEQIAQAEPSATNLQSWRQQEQKRRQRLRQRGVQAASRGALHCSSFMVSSDARAHTRERTRSDRAPTRRTAEQASLMQPGVLLCACLCAADALDVSSRLIKLDDDHSHVIFAVLLLELLDKLVTRFLRRSSLVPDKPGDHFV